MAGSRRFAYVTLLTRTSYLAGVLVLWYGLLQSNSKYPLVVMITRSLSDDSRNVLRKFGILTKEVDPLRPSREHQFAEEDVRFADTWTKLRVFSLLEYDRIVFLDSDMLVKQNMDDLFQRELERDQIAAVHVCACNPFQFEHYPADWIPQNCPHSTVSNPNSPPPTTSTSESTPRPYTQLNSGTLVLSPSKPVFDTIMRVLNNENTVKDFAFPDQDLLSFVFRDKWIPLPWYYNALRTMRISHMTLWDDALVRCVHYILADKPWHSRNRVRHPEFEKLNGWWWDAFDELEVRRQRERGAGGDEARWPSARVDNL